MPCMVVTLDVSKFSDWLKAVAYCPAERRACMRCAWGEEKVRAGRGAGRERCGGPGEGGGERREA